MTAPPEPPGEPTHDPQAPQPAYPTPPISPQHPEQPPTPAPAVPPQGPPPGGSYPPGGYPAPPPSPPYPGQPGGYPGYQPAPPPSPLYGYGQPPEVPAGMYYDRSTELVLPNGTQLASHARRIGAWFLSIALFIVTLVIGYIIWGLIVWSRGQTPTYQVLGMRCWRPETKRVATWGWMALREVVGRLIEGAFGIVAVASFIMFLVLKQRRTIHDYIGGTVVVHDPNGVLAPQT
jgi:uncharacterized RDD family membrane protein YckC